MKQYMMWAVLVLIVMVLWIWAVTENKMVKWVIRFCCSSISILILNIIVPEYAVAFNGFSLGVAAGLGVPGVMTLYVLRMIF